MKTKVEPTKANEPTIVMSRTFDAPREVVWAAFTDPKHVAKWYGGHGFTNPVCEMDVRPGGIWRHVMRTPSGTEYEMKFVFVEVVRPEKLVWRDSDYAERPPGGHPASIMTVTLADAGSQTRWTLVTRFRTVADRDAALESGFTSTLSEGTDKFDELVKALRRTGSADLLSPHGVASGTFAPVLRTLSTLLDKGAEHASAKKYDSRVLVAARLAPDMFSLAQQVEMACFYAKDATARVAGGDPPQIDMKFDETIDQLKARIERAIAELEKVGPDAFEGAEERRVEMALGGGMVLDMTAPQFLRDWGLPHFYFHVVTAYDILRHNGVQIGKQDYLGHIGAAIRATHPGGKDEGKGRAR